MRQYYIINIVNKGGTTESIRPLKWMNWLFWILEVILWPNVFQIKKIKGYYMNIYI